MEESLFLTKFASKVTVVHRRDALRGSRIMQQRAQDNPKIEFVTNIVVEEMVSHDDKKRFKGAKVRDTKTNETSFMECDGIFMAIGHKPNTEVFAGQLETDDKGYIVVHDHTRTSIEGVFAAGDVADSVYRQAITAAGMGCKAALDAERFLSGH